MRASCCTCTSQCAQLAWQMGQVQLLYHNADCLLHCSLTAHPHQTLGSNVHKQILSADSEVAMMQLIWTCIERAWHTLARLEYQTVICGGCYSKCTRPLQGVRGQGTLGVTPLLPCAECSRAKCMWLKASHSALDSPRCRPCTAVTKSNSKKKH